MAKKGQYHEHVKRLYVEEGRSHEAIALLLPVSEKAQRIWKEEDKKTGVHWDALRAAYQQARRSFHQDLYEFGRELLDQVRNDLKEGREPAQSVVYLLKDVLGKVKTVQAYEENVAQKEKEGRPSEGLTPEKVQEIREKLLGG